MIPNPAPLKIRAAAPRPGNGPDIVNDHAGSADQGDHLDGLVGEMLEIGALDAELLELLETRDGFLRRTGDPSVCAAFEERVRVSVRIVEPAKRKTRATSPPHPDAATASWPRFRARTLKGLWRRWFRRLSRTPTCPGG